MALYTALVLRAQEELEVEWGTVGKGFVCSLRICNQIWKQCRIALFTGGAGGVFQAKILIFVVCFNPKIRETVI